MHKYQNLSGESGVLAYEALRDSITVVFTDGSAYLYDSTRPGWYHVQQMITLARTGRGLATYINQHVRKDFAKKLR